MELPARWPYSRAIDLCSVTVFVRDRHVSGRAERPPLPRVGPSPAWCARRRNIIDGMWTTVHSKLSIALSAKLIQKMFRLRKKARAAIAAKKESNLTA